MKALTITGYATLRNKVREALLLGRQKIEEAKVRTYWETGRLINEHVLTCKDRADYGRQVILKLAEDLKVSETVLHRCARFAKQFPILAGRPKFSWSHYRALITVPDKKRMLEFVRKAENEAWTAGELESAIHKAEPFQPARLKSGKAEEPLIPKRGALYTYRILDPKTIQPKEPGLLLIDLGFSCYRDLDVVTSKSFEPFDIVESVKTGDDQYKLQKSGKTAEALFTYKATVEKIVDGDTLRAVIDLGFNTRTRQYLRLRALDCPEIDTQEGKAAAEFVRAQITASDESSKTRRAVLGAKATSKQADEIILTSSKSDKYDRYLADVFFTDKTGKQVYLNNLLLEQGHAVPMPIH